MFRRIVLIGALAAIIGVATALAAGYGAGAKPANSRAHRSARIVIHVFTDYVRKDGSVYRVYGGCGQPVRVTRLGPRKAFSLETRHYTIPVAPGTYRVVMEEYSHDPHNPSRRVTVKNGKTAVVTFGSGGGCYY